MSNQFTLAFEGMCGFVDRTGQIEAYLPSGHGDHLANLMIPSEFLMIDNTTWKPTTIAMMRDTTGYRQVAIWDLRGEDLTIESSAGASGSPSWDKADTIDLSKYHKVATRPGREILLNDKRAGVVTLKGKASKLRATTPNATEDSFELFKNKVSQGTHTFSRILEWQPPDKEVPVFTNSHGQVIDLLYSADAWGCVANVAAVTSEEGLKHFHHYYLGLDALTAGDYPLRLENKFVHVYDCVPPAAWP